MPSAPDVARLYAAHAARVHRWVQRFGIDDAEAVVHEVFVRAIERLDGFRADASPTTWLFRLTTNYCINRLRDDNRRAELWRDRGDAHWQSALETGDQELVATLRQMWRRLDPELVEVAIYHYVDSMTHAEIARVVGCSERTIGNRLERLRQATHHAMRGTP